VSTLTARNTAGADLPYDSAEISPGDIVTLTTRTTSPENTTNIQTVWKHLQDQVAGWRLTNGGAGYVMRPGKVLAWATVRVGRFSANSDDGRQMAWFALTWRATGDVADQVNKEDTKFCFIDDSNTTTGVQPPTVAITTPTLNPFDGDEERVIGHLSGAQQHVKYARIGEHNLMLWTIIDKSAVVGAWTLNRLEVKGAICRGASNAPGNAINCYIYGGSIGFIGLNDR
jgi:hypothetical protein